MGPLLPFFLVYAAGLLTALPASRHLPYIIPIVLTLFALTLILNRKKNRMTPCVLLIGLFVFGWVQPSLREKFQPADHILYQLKEGQHAEVTGRLIESPGKFSNRTNYLIELSTIRYGEAPFTPVSGRARITLYAPENSLQPGDVVQISNIHLKFPRNFKNPGRFDYENYLESQGINVIGSVSKPESLKKTGTIPLSIFSGLRHAARQKMFHTIDRYLNEDEAGLIKAMLLGEKKSLREEVKEDYRATGIAHLMAVSGLHMGFVAFSVYFFAYPLAFSFLRKYYPDTVRAGGSRKAAVLLTLVAVLFYGILVGAKVSALRAGMMVLIFLLAILVNRTGNLFNALMLAAFILLLWNPKFILDIGFQLSFSAVFSILFVFQFIRKEKKDAIDRMMEPNRVSEYLQGSLWVTLAANLGTLPIITMHFNRISLIGFFLNIFMVPLAAVLIPLALLALALGLLWEQLATPFMPFISAFLKMFIAVPHFFAALPYASIYLATPRDLWFVLYYTTFFGGVFWFYNYRQSHRQLDTPPKPWLKPAGTGLVFVTLWTVLWMVWPRFLEWPTDKLSVTILDVGSGESIFIEFPNHQNLLIDGGGFYGDRFDIGRFVVAPALWHRGIDKIDYMAATHSDNDHIDGLESLIDIMQVDHLLYRETGDHRMHALRQKAQARGAVPLTLQPGEFLSVGEVTITALHPNADYTQRVKQSGARRSSNSLSMVLRLDYREFSMLFAADIGKKEEHYLAGNKTTLHADFLKAPHHGSRFSNTDEFIEAVQPRWVFFSSGYLNPFHHPHPTVIERYKKSGAKVWRTDLQGSITITSNGYEHITQAHEDL